MVNGELSLNGIIEVERFIIPFRFLRSSLTKEELLYLAEAGKFIQVEVEGNEKFEYIMFHPFLRTLRRVFYDVTELFEQRNQYFADIDAKS